MSSLGARKYFTFVEDQLGKPALVTHSDYSGRQCTVVQANTHIYSKTMFTNFWHTSMFLCFLYQNASKLKSDDAAGKSSSQDLQIQFWVTAYSPLARGNSAMRRLYLGLWNIASNWLLYTSAVWDQQQCLPIH